MDIDRLFSDRDFLEKEISFFMAKKHIIRLFGDHDLARAHINKSRHNLEFFKINKSHVRFNDWLIVILYYSLYHSALALMSAKGYHSKNHYATILILIKEYSITKEEAELIQELCINKNDAELYSNLKDERHNASYSTDSEFRNDKISEYEIDVMGFMNKATEILRVLAVY